MRIESFSDDNLKSQLTEIRKIAFFLENGCLDTEKNSLISKLKAMTLSYIEEQQLVSDLLGASIHLPRNIALKLAKSNLEIAAKILRHHPNFSDEELISLIAETDNNKKLCLIAERDKVHQNVIDALVKKGIDIAITLMKNPNIAIMPHQIVDILNRYSHLDKVIELFKLVKTEDLSTAIEQVDKDAKEVIEKKFKTFLKKSKRLNELNILNLKEDSLFSSQEELILKENVDIFFSKNLLTNAVIIRFLCKGDIYSFIYSLCKHSNIPFLSIKKIIFEDVDKEKFKKIYTATHLPNNMLSSIWLLLSIINKHIRKGTTKIEDFHSNLKKELQSYSQNKRYNGIDFLIGLMN